MYAATSLGRKLGLRDSIFSGLRHLEYPGTGFECAVCIAEFEDKDDCRVLGCMHCFHSSCIDRWLGRSEACPTCKHPVLLSS